jgi:hypothetical protein
MAFEDFLSADDGEEREQKERPGFVGALLSSGKRGVSTNIGLVTEALPALAYSIAGDEEGARAKLGEFKIRLDELARTNPTLVEDFTKINSVSDAIIYFAEALGENAPSLIGGLGAGTVGMAVGKKLAKDQAEEIAKRYAMRGAAAGAASYSATQNIPETFAEVARETGELAPVTALVFGGAKVALDAIPTFRALSTITKDAVEKHLGKRILREAGVQFGAEGATEVGQELLDESAKKFIDENHEIFTGDNLIRFADTFLKAGISGAAMGGASAALQRPGQEPPPPEEPKPKPIEYPPEGPKPIVPGGLAMEEAIRQAGARAIPDPRLVAPPDTPLVPYEAEPSASPLEQVLQSAGIRKSVGQEVAEQSDTARIFQKLNEDYDFQPGDPIRPGDLQLALGVKAPTAHAVFQDMRKSGYFVSNPRGPGFILNPQGTGGIVQHSGMTPNRVTQLTANQISRPAPPPTGELSPQPNPSQIAQETVAAAQQQTRPAGAQPDPFAMATRNFIEPLPAGTPINMGIFQRESGISHTPLAREILDRWVEAGAVQKMSDGTYRKAEHNLKAMPKPPSRSAPAEASVLPGTPYDPRSPLERKDMAAVSPVPPVASTPQARNQTRRADPEQVRKALKPILGEDLSRVQFPDQINNVDLLAANSGIGENIRGRTHGDAVSSDFIIEVATNQPTANAKSTGYHEALHLLELLGKITKQDLAVLDAARDQLRALIRTSKNPVLEGLNVDAITNPMELRAYAFEAYMYARDNAQNLSGLSGRVRQILNKAYQFFNRLRNAVHGLGFQDYGDVYEAVVRGERAGGKSHGAHLQRGNARTIKKLPDQIATTFDKDHEHSYDLPNESFDAWDAGTRDGKRVRVMRAYDKKNNWTNWIGHINDTVIVEDSYSGDNRDGFQKTIDKLNKVLETKHDDIDTITHDRLSEALINNFDFYEVDLQPDHYGQRVHVMTLREIHDTFNRIAKILNVPRDAISLGGRLGLIVQNSRHVNIFDPLTGGTRSFGGVYQPGSNAIIVGNEPSVIPHEWMHAFDYYLQRKFGTTIARHAYPFSDIVDDSIIKGMRPELLEAWNQIHEVIDTDENYLAESRQKDAEQGRLDDPYWSNSTEMFARAFEAYYESKDTELGPTRTTSPSFPYPRGKDLERLNAAFDNFFKTLRHKRVYEPAFDREVTELYAKSLPIDMAAMSARKQMAEPVDIDTPEEIGKYWQVFGSAKDIANRSKQFRPFERVLDAMRQLQNNILNTAMERFGPVAALPVKRQVEVTRFAEIMDMGDAEVTERDGSMTATATKDGSLVRKGDTVVLKGPELAAYKSMRSGLSGIWKQTKQALLANLGLDENYTAADLQRLAQEDKGRHRFYRNVATLLDDMEQKERIGYVPHVRLGEWAISVHHPTEVDETGKPKLLWYQHVDKPFIGSVRAKIQKIGRDLKQRFPEGEIKAFKPTKDYFKGELRDAVGIIEQFAAVMGTQDKDGTLADFMDELREALNTQDFRRHIRLKREGTPGWVTPENKDNYLRQALTLYASRSSHFIARQRYLNDMRDAMVKIKSPSINQYAKRLYDYVKSGEEEFAGLRALAFHWFLGGNISSAALNLTQTLHATWPYARMFTKDATVWKEIGRAMKDAAQMSSRNLQEGFVDFTKNKPKGITDDEWAMLQDLHSKGLVLPVLTRDLQANNFMARLTNDPTIDKGLIKLAQISSSAFNYTENLNRITAALVGHRLAKLSGTEAKWAKTMSKTRWAAEPFSPELMARAFVEDTQGVFAKENRPELLRGWKSVPLQFTSFPLFMLNQWITAFDRYGGANHAAGRRMIAALAMGIFLTAGAWGMPLGEPMKKAFEALTRLLTHRNIDLDKEFREMVAAAPPTEWLADLFGTSKARIAEYAARGPVRATGVDISRRTGLEIIPSDFLRGEFNPLGPAGSIVSAPADFFHRLGQGQNVLAVAALLPTAVKNIFASALAAKEGYTSQAGRKLPVGELSLGESYAHSIGFTPTKVTEARELLGAERVLKEGMKDAREGMYDRLAKLRLDAIMAGRSGNSQAASRSMKEFRDLVAEAVAHDRRQKNPSDMYRLDLKNVTSRVRDDLIALNAKRNMRRTPVALRRETMGLSDVYPAAGGNK